MARVVLFDFDGTLADTAPDLALALNRVRAEEHLAPLPDEAVRAVASSGARGMLGVGFGITPQEGRFQELRDRFLEHYASAVCVHTTLFEGIPELLAALEDRGLRWGIVTNKSARFTLPVVSVLGLEGRPACVVSGDTTERMKPAPDPLLFAANVIGVPTGDCLYVGDDLRDVQAAHAAGMKALAAAYGYLSGGNPHAWGADGIIERPMQLLDFLD